MSPHLFSLHRMGSALSALSPMTLPMGPDAPKYRPSPQPRSVTGVPREDGRVSASPPVRPSPPSPVTHGRMPVLLHSRKHSQ